jgi:hypothetical protein
MMAFDLVGFLDQLRRESSVVHFYVFLHVCMCLASKTNSTLATSQKSGTTIRTCGQLNTGETGANAPPAGARAHNWWRARSTLYHSILPVCSVERNICMEACTGLAVTRLRRSCVSRIDTNNSPRNRIQIPEAWTLTVSLNFITASYRVGWRAAWSPWPGP